MKTFIEVREYAFDKFSEKTSPKIAKEIEKSIVEYTKQASQLRKIYPMRWSDVRVRRLYLRKMRMILWNLDYLLKMIENNVIIVCEAAFIHHYDIRPDIWDPIKEMMKTREINTIIMNSDDKYDGLLKCENCSSMKTRYVTLQTRSADEPMTVFATCLDCNTNWTS